MITVIVLTISDSGASGLREDASGPAVRQRCRNLGGRSRSTPYCRTNMMRFKSNLQEWADSMAAQVILTTGGTGRRPSRRYAGSDRGGSRAPDSRVGRGDASEGQADEVRLAVAGICRDTWHYIDRQPTGLTKRRRAVARRNCRSDSAHYGSSGRTDGAPTLKTEAFLMELSGGWRSLDRPAAAEWTHKRVFK